MVVMLGYLKTRLVVVVVEKLVNDQESRPVSAARKSDADKLFEISQWASRIANKLSKWEMFSLK